MNLEMICYILEYQYFNDFQKRHLEIQNEQVQFQMAFPDEWKQFSIEEKVGILKEVINRKVDLQDILEQSEKYYK